MSNQTLARVQAAGWALIAVGLLALLLASGRELERVLLVAGVVLAAAGCALVGLRFIIKG